METVISTTENNLTVSDANIEELRIRLTQTETDFQRYKQLLEQNAVTRQQYDNVKADYEATKAKYDMLIRQKMSTSLLKKNKHNVWNRIRPILKSQKPHRILLS